MECSICSAEDKNCLALGCGHVLCSDHKSENENEEDCPLCNSENLYLAKIKIDRIKEDEDIYKNLICSICTGLLNEPLSQKCGHSFCLDCLSRTGKKNSPCPVCGAKIDNLTDVNLDLKNKAEYLRNQYNQDVHSFIFHEILNEESNKLKKIKENELKKIKADFEKYQGLKCSICIEMYTKPVTLRCNHSFCYECIKNWVAAKQNCPNCRIRTIEVPKEVNTELDERVERIKSRYSESVNSVIFEKREKDVLENLILKPQKKKLKEKKSDRVEVEKNLSHRNSLVRPENAVLAQEINVVNFIRNEEEGERGYNQSINRLLIRNQNNNRNQKNFFYGPTILIILALFFITFV